MNKDRIRLNMSKETNNLLLSYKEIKWGDPFMDTSLGYAINSLYKEFPKDLSNNEMISLWKNTDFKDFNLKEIHTTLLLDKNVISEIKERCNKISSQFYFSSYLKAMLSWYYLNNKDETK